MAKDKKKNPNLTTSFSSLNHLSPDIAPVIEGAVHHIASRRFEMGGLDLTKLLAQELGKSNPLVNISLSDIERIKELYSCCADDDLAYEKLQKSCQTETHTLPDGQVHVLPWPPS